MIIYKATNKIDGKVYIGQTINSLLHRKKQHMWDAHTRPLSYFLRAIKKYGTGGFWWRVICICPNVDSLNEQEEHYIAYYNSMEDGYNRSSGGRNHIPSKETKEKIRQSLFGRYCSEETRKKRSQSLMGHTTSQETKDKIRQSLAEYHLNKLKQDEARQNKPKRNKARQEVSVGGLVLYFTNQPM